MFIVDVAEPHRQNEQWKTTISTATGYVRVRIDIAHKPHKDLAIHASTHNSSGLPNLDFIIFLIVFSLISYCK